MSSLQIISVQVYQLIITIERHRGQKVLWVNVSLYLPCVWTLLATRRLPLMFTVRRITRTYGGRLSQVVRGNASLSVGETTAQQPVAPPPVAPASKAQAPANEKTSSPASLPDSLSLSRAKSPPSQPSTEEKDPEKKTPTRKWPTRRPNISLANPREWNRPLAKGVLPAYDHALQYVRSDSELLRGELAELREKLRAEEAKPEGGKDEEALKEMQEKVKILEIQSAVNLPDIRWKANNGMGE